MFRSVTVLALITLAFGIAAVVAAPYQELAPRAGHVPVYIREGDTPLSEIHPGLAEAFGEPEGASLKVESNIDEEALVAQPDTIATATEAPAAPPKAEEDVKQDSTEEVKSAEVAKAETLTVDKSTPAESTTDGNDGAADEKPKAQESDIASFDVIKMLEADGDLRS